MRLERPEVQLLKEGVAQHFCGFLPRQEAADAGQARDLSSLFDITNVLMFSEKSCKTLFCVLQLMYQSV